MIAITISEKEAIKKRFPDLHIARTMKQDSSRHHYYMVEEPAPMRMLRELRGEVVPTKQPRNNRYGASRKKYNKGV